MRHLSLTFITFVIAWSCTNFKEEEAPVHLSSDVYEYSSSERLTEFHLNVSSGSKWYITYMPYWINLQSIDESPRSPYEWDVNFEIEGNGEYGREGQIDIYNETGESIYVTVSQAGAKGKYIALESLEINSALTTIIEGQSQQLSVRYFPSNASEKQVIWTSSDPYVAQVSESGLLTAISVGSATITVHSEDGKHIAKCIFNVISKTIDVTGVSLDNTSITMTEGTTQTLTATVAPENATDKSVTWSSNNISVATVSSSGVVTAKAAGTATITVKTNDGAKTATCSVTVKAATVAVTGVSLDKNSLSLRVGDVSTLTATVMPSNATDKSVTWSSSNTAIATVSSTGVVTANNVGSAVITVATNDGNLTASCSVSVGYAIPGIVDLGIGVKWGSFNLGAVKPEDSGYYYPWGYTEPQAFSHNDFIWFFLDSYKWYYSPDRTLTKYCSNASYGRNGYTDNKNVLDKEDDAAYVNLGSQWRLPTAGDYSLLQEKCSWEWKSVNGVGGYEVTGPNGNSIFLPAAGYGYFTEFHDFGALGHCWSSSLKTEYPYNAYALKCGSSVIENESMSRSFLLPVRPVFGESTYVSITGVSLNASSISMTVGDTQTLTATITPSNATDKSVTWSSNNTSVATVSSSGVVTAKAAGTATITVNTNDGGKTATCTVTVKASTVAVTGVSLDKSKMYSPIDNTQALTATVTPSDATDKSVSWSSSNTSIATVSSSGIVTTKSPGTARITVTTKDGSKTASCIVKVASFSYDYVDLGLSSGLKWATCNLGASSPEESGDFFAWGETIPRENSTFTWGTYKWYDSSTNTLIKYYSSSPSVLLYSDDAASVNLGGNWRMPTNTEWYELINSCTWTWTGNGVSILGPNGSSIFLPSAGLGVVDAGYVGGYYWSSSLNISSTDSAWAVSFYLNNINRGKQYRYFGSSIRPVMD